ncbi:MAG: hypothetical protein ORO03_00865, partial [Alphaproteobacteria bacterium]|nr:hypothetical protein [Alphaproteobacteria bacterium]
MPVMPSSSLCSGAILAASLSKAEPRPLRRHASSDKAKGVRNPLTFTESVGPFLEAAWEYRKENPRGADFLILD